MLKAFFNWSIGHGLAASNPVRRVKLFHEDNSRLRYLTREEYDRLLAAAQTLRTRTSISTPSPYLVEKIVLAAHTGLRRGSLFNLRWDQIDLENLVLRIPRTKSGRPLSVPLNVTAHDTLKALHDARDPVGPYVFPHRVGKHAIRRSRRHRALRRARKRKGQEKGKATRATRDRDRKCRTLLRILAPRAGFEPATLRLTDWCRCSFSLVLRRFSRCREPAVTWCSGVNCSRIDHRPANLRPRESKSRRPPGR